MKKYIFFNIILIVSCTYLYEICAADYNSDASVEFRSFDQEIIDQYKQNKDFYYAINKPPNKLWESFKAWLGKIIKKLFNSIPDEKLPGIVYTIIKTILWICGIGALILLFYSLFKQGAFSVVAKNDKTIHIDFNELEDKVIETDWLKLIEQETVAKRFKTAVRLLFLYTLQQLNSKGLIVWDKGKTNREYIRELSSYHKGDNFKHLTLYYNYIWFGDFSLSESSFNDICNQFQNFNTDNN